MNDILVVVQTLGPVWTEVAVMATIPILGPLVGGAFVLFDAILGPVLGHVVDWSEDR